MTISSVQVGGNTFDGDTTVNLKSGSNNGSTGGSDVTSGNLLQVRVVAFNSNGQKTFIAGDLTKASGTATIGTVALDAQMHYANGGAFIDIAFYSVLVTASGTLILTLADLESNSFGTAAIDECSATSGWDGSRFEDSASGSGQGGSTSSSGAVDSASGGILVGCCGWDSGDQPATMTQDTNWQETYSEPDGATSLPSEHIRRIVTSTTSDDANWTAIPTNNHWFAAAAAYKEVTPGGGGASILRQMMQHEA